MPRWKVTFYSLQPVARSVYVDDDLDEMDQDDLIYEASMALRNYLQANGEETSGWDDPEFEVVD